MSDLRYAPPTAELEEVVQVQDAQFFVVSVTKLWVMSLGTFGLYKIYWFYKNWDNFKRSTGTRLQPALRAIFAIFFVHKLFSWVDERLTEQRKQYEWNPSGLATWLVAIYLVQSVLSRTGKYESRMQLGGAVIILLSIPISTWLVTRVQRAINVAENDPAGSSNSRFTAGNIVWLVIGMLMWVGNIAAAVMAL